MKSGGKDPSVSSTYLILSRTRLRHSRHTAEELLSWLTRWVDCALPRGQWARPSDSASQRSVIFNVMVRRLRGSHPLIKRPFRVRRACPHDRVHNSSSTLTAVPGGKSFTCCQCVVQAPKTRASTIANPAPSVYAGVVTPARKSAGFEMYICTSASFSFQQWSPDRGRSISQPGRWNT
jgi:hypothetical protein